MVWHIRESKPESSGLPFEVHRGGRAWKIVDQAINDLVDNKDIVETTRRDYIVGYICTKLESILPKTGA